MELPFPTDLAAFVLWLGLNGLTVVALLEKLPVFQSLNARWKSVVALAVTLGAPFAAEGLTAALALLDPATLATVQHYLDLALMGLRLWAASQYAHGGLRQLVAPKPK